MKKIAIFVIALCFGTWLIVALTKSMLATWATTRPNFELITVCLGGQEYEVEHADSFWKQLWGLSQIDTAPSQGMLFSYLLEQKAHENGLWMYRTAFPIVIGFISQNGEIVDVKSMTPCTGEKHDCPVYHSSEDYSMAIEFPFSAANTAEVATGQKFVLGVCEE